MVNIYQNMAFIAPFVVWQKNFGADRVTMDSNSRGRGRDRERYRKEEIKFPKSFPIFINKSREKDFWLCASRASIKHVVLGQNPTGNIRKYLEGAVISPSQKQFNLVYRFDISDFRKLLINTSDGDLLMIEEDVESEWKEYNSSNSGSSGGLLSKSLDFFEKKGFQKYNCYHDEFPNYFEKESTQEITYYQAILWLNEWLNLYMKEHPDKIGVIIGNLSEYYIRMMFQDNEGCWKLVIEMYNNDIT